IALQARLSAQSLVVLFHLPEIGEYELKRPLYSVDRLVPYIRDFLGILALALLFADRAGMINQLLQIAGRSFTLRQLRRCDQVVIELLLRVGELAAHLVDKVRNDPDICLLHAQHRVPNANVRSWEEVALLEEAQVVAVGI